MTRTAVSHSHLKKRARLHRGRLASAHLLLGFCRDCATLLDALSCGPREARRARRKARKAEVALARARDTLREAKALMEEGYDHAAYEVILAALSEEK